MNVKWRHRSMRWMCGIPESGRWGVPDFWCRDTKSTRTKWKVVPRKWSNDERMDFVHGLVSRDQPNSRNSTGAFWKTCQISREIQEQILYFSRKFHMLFSGGFLSAWSNKNLHVTILNFFVKHFGHQHALQWKNTRMKINKHGCYVSL